MPSACAYPKELLGVDATEALLEADL